MTKVDLNKVIRKDPPMRYPDGGSFELFFLVLLIIALILYASIV